MVKFMPINRSMVFLGLASAGILVSAWFYQYVLDLAPCGLCLTQRTGHYIIIPVAAGGTLLWQLLPKYRPAIQALVLAVICLAAAYSAYWAGFHIGVENKWWPGLATCGGSDTSGMTFEQLMNTPFVPCDQPTIIFKWLFGGLSMATIHLILLIPLLGFALWSLFQAVGSLLKKEEPKHV